MAMRGVISGKASINNGIMAVHPMAKAYLEAEEVEGLEQAAINLRDRPLIGYYFISDAVSLKLRLPK